MKGTTRVLCDNKREKIKTADTSIGYIVNIYNINEQSNEVDQKDIWIKEKKKKMKARRKTYMILIALICLRFR